MRYLRVLDLSRSNIKMLSSKIGELLHLRYLDLSDNASLTLLPSSLCELYNLQTLKLRRCSNLKKLPRNLSKLVNLRYLDIQFCDSLSHMPSGMNSMICLCKLKGFVVNKRNNGWFRGSEKIDGLTDLKTFTNLSGVLEIKINKGFKYVKEAREREILLNKRHIMHIKIGWFGDNEQEGNNAESLLQSLQPHANLRGLELRSYPGVSFPGWGDSSINLECCLPNLAKLKLHGCSRLEHLPFLSHLQHLKVLMLEELGKLEYVVSRSGDQTPTSGRESTFFPSLEKLELQNLPLLKGFSSQSLSPSFPRLSSLKLIECTSLKNFPLCPKLRQLELWNKASLNKLSFHESPLPISRESIEIDSINARYINSLATKAFKSFPHLQIRKADNIERLTTSETFGSGHMSHVCSIEIAGCLKLERLPGRGMWEHLTALKSLVLCYLPELDFEEDNSAEIPWQYVSHTLRSLELERLPKLVKLPKGMQNLNALHSLVISDCPNLEALPDWIGCLSSLESINVQSCKSLKSLPDEMNQLTRLRELDLWLNSEELQERCQDPTGIDWPKIQHVPYIRVSV